MGALNLAAAAWLSRFDALMAPHRCGLRLPRPPEKQPRASALWVPSEARCAAALAARVFRICSVCCMSSNMRSGCSHPRSPGALQWPARSTDERRACDARCRSSEASLTRTAAAAVAGVHLAAAARGRAQAALALHEVAGAALAPELLRPLAGALALAAALRRAFAAHAPALAEALPHLVTHARSGLLARALERAGAGQLHRGQRACKRLMACWGSKAVRIIAGYAREHSVPAMPRACAAPGSP